MEKGRNCSPGAISPLSTIFCNLIFEFCVKTRTRFSLRDKRLFEITEVEITRVDCNSDYKEAEGWLGGAKALGKLPVLGRPTNLDYSRAGAYCACSRCG